jgi:hypothetical protein
MAEKPRRSVRRFDVFAEYNRQKAMKEGQPEDQAKGYGIWLAKVVASRRYGGLPKKTLEQGKGGEQSEPAEELVDGKWRTLSGEPQTDELFDKEVVNRMGRDFYEDVFVPAIEQAFQRGQRYEDIRDEIRADWKAG